MIKGRLTAADFGIPIFIGVCVCVFARHLLLKTLWFLTASTFFGLISLKAPAAFYSNQGKVI